MDSNQTVDRPKRDRRALETMEVKWQSARRESAWCLARSLCEKKCRTGRRIARGSDRGETDPDGSRRFPPSSEPILCSLLAPLAPQHVQAMLRNRALLATVSAR